MEPLTNPFLLKQLEDNKREFIKLTGKIFAEYQIIYHINDCCPIKDITRFSDKYQLQFHKFQSKQQQLNLIYVDSFFIEILADIALDVFLNIINTFSDFIDMKKSIRNNDNEFEMECIFRKILYFICLLSYSDIAENKASKGEEFTHRIFFIKNEAGEIDFYTINDRSKLFDLLMEKMKLKIDMNKSSISGGDVNLCLTIYMD